MAVSSQILQSSINIKAISQNVASSQRGVSAAAASTKKISEILITTSKVKSSIFDSNRILKSRRLEISRRKDIEDSLEMSTIDASTSIGRSQIIQRSGKGFLGRIMDAISFLAIGWLAGNMPTWISIGTQFIDRIKKTGQIISGFVNNTVNLIQGFGNLLQSYAENILSFDLFDSSKRVQSAFDDLGITLTSMGDQIEGGFKLLTSPLSPSTPTPGTEAPESLYQEPPTSMGEVKRSTPPASNKAAFDKVKNWASAAGSPAPEITAAIAMNESGWLKSPMATMDNNVFGQTGVGPSGYVIGSDGQKHQRYTSQQQAVEYHVRYWKKYYKGNTVDEIFRSLVAAGYNTATPSWRSTNEGIYESMTGKSRNSPISKETSPTPSTPSTPAVSSTKQDTPSVPKLQPKVSGKNGQLDESSLVPVQGSYKLRSDAASAFRNLQSAAQKSGVQISLSSAYRSYEKQQYLWNNRASNPYPVAAPGTSNHGWGTSIDVPEGPVNNWIKKYGRSYGWIPLPGDAVHFDFKGGGGIPLSPQAEISTGTARSGVSETITPDREGKMLFIEDSGSSSSGNGGQVVDTSNSGKAASIPVSESKVLNSFIKNKLLLELSYT
jgi:hypothetical protein